MLILPGPYPPEPPPPPGPVQNDPFIYQTPSYVACMDGIGGYGMDTGGGFRPRFGGTPELFYITTTSANVGTGTQVGSSPTIWECSLPFACERDVNNKVIINLTSGAFDFTSTEVNLRGDNVSMIGFTCRAGTGYGAYIRSRHPLYIRGNDVVLWGWRFFQDSGGTDPAGPLRDNVTLGWNPNTGYHVIGGCEFHGGIDECVSFYDSTIAASIVESAIVSPLEGTAISEDLSHNYGVIAGHNLNRFTALRCAFFHTAGRVPLSYARYTSIANCLVYNPSDGRGNLSNCIQIDRHPDDAQSEAHYAAILNSLMLNGPQGYADNYPITSQELLSGSQIYASGLSQMGFSSVSTAETFFGNRTGYDARQWRVTTLPASTIPGAWGSSHEYVDTFADTVAGRLELITKLRATCGVQPKDPGITALSDKFTQAENYVNSVGSGYGAVASTQSYPSVTSFTIDPTNSSHVSSYWGGNSLPAAADFFTVGGDGITAGETWIRAIRRLSYGY